jgi:isochorismate pyruvate lyase
VMSAHVEIAIHQRTCGGLSCQSGRGGRNPIIPRQSARLDCLNARDQQSDRSLRRLFFSPASAIACSIQDATRARMKTAAECNSMAEIRAEIDQLDLDLVTLFARRTTYIDRAAQIKTTVGLPARIDDRVEQVIENVRRHALAQGLPPEQFETIWRGLVDWSIAREETYLGKEDDHEC